MSGKSIKKDRNKIVFIFQTQLKGRQPKDPSKNETKHNFSLTSNFLKFIKNHNLVKNQKHI